METSTLAHMSQKPQNVPRSILGEADKFGTHSFNKRYLKESETHWHQTAAWPLRYACTQPYHLGVTAMNSCFTLQGLISMALAIRPCMIRVMFRGSPLNTYGSHWLGTAWQFIIPRDALRKVLCGADVAMRRNPATELVNCKPVLVFNCSKFLTLFTGTWPAINQILQRWKTWTLNRILKSRFHFLFSFVLHSLSHYHTIKSNKKINKG